MGKDSKLDDPEYKARAAALRLLARREHSRQELSLKLRQRNIEQSVIDLVLDEYEEEGWLDDHRFADVYSRQRIDAGYGPVRIMAELQQRGVHFRPECLEEKSDADWARVAAELREKRFGLSRLSDDLAEKLRQARFLARRGFSSAQLERALRLEAAEQLWGDEEF
ncbi:regulatory protein RecX [Marinobacter sp. JH2]|uniref:regulatory protein RecX n=1 Tax=Marinobacter sp. AL4B TaxID=2871173 RepID=UPI0010561E5F|nr:MULTISPECIES: regulatory protein RecX [unclassified Marinobacter]MBZ0333367.1 recombination regulator RecX [Marinobacter sp. AL4B]QBM16585.1 regulatory protein RecX [Marinobacter sp. JH2]